MDKKASGPVRRVLMTADTVGGVWTYTLTLSRHLAEHGIEVLLAAMGAPLRPAQREQAKSIPNLLLEATGYRLEWMDDPWEDVRAAGQWLQALAASYSPDLIHLNGYAHAALRWPAPVLVVAHSDVLSWWQCVKGETAPAYWSEYREQVTRGLQSADVVVAPTQAMADLLADHYPLREPARIIYNGCESERYSPAAKEALILAAGRVWDEAKNLAALQAVAPDLSWPVYIAGDECHPTHGRSFGWGAVRPLGIVAPEELRGWFARASIYALPARYEPFGLSAVEAALSGCALVLGDIPSLREVWGDAAWYVAPGRVDELRAALQTLIADESTRVELGRQARARALTYGGHQMAHEYVRLYGEMLAHDRALQPVKLAS